MILVRTDVVDASLSVLGAVDNAFGQRLGFDLSFEGPALEVGAKNDLITAEFVRGSSPAAFQVFLRTRRAPAMTPVGCEGLNFTIGYDALVE